MIKDLTFNLVFRVIVIGSNSSSSLTSLIFLIPYTLEDDAYINFNFIFLKYLKMVKRNPN